MPFTPLVMGFSSCFLRTLVGSNWPLVVDGYMRVLKRYCAGARTSGMPHCASVTDSPGTTIYISILVSVNWSRECFGPRQGVIARLLSTPVNNQNYVYYFKRIFAARYRQ